MKPQDKRKIIALGSSLWFDVCYSFILCSIIKFRSIAIVKVGKVFWPEFLFGKWDNHTYWDDSYQMLNINLATNDTDI